MRATTLTPLLLGACSVAAPSPQPATAHKATLGPAPGVAALNPAPIARTSPRSSVELQLDSDATSPSKIAEPSGTVETAQQQFWLAARFRTPNNSHIYWINPGETGIPTLAQFSAPSGFRLSEVQYPGPERFASERGTVGYGYSGEAALLVKVTPPPSWNIADGARFTVDASWLACSQICTKERGRAELQLTPAHREQTTRAISDYVQLLPQYTASVTTQLLGEGSHRITLPRDYQAIDFFPIAPALTPDGRAPTTQPGPSSNSLHVVFAGMAASEQQFRGVVKAKLLGAPNSYVRYFQVQIH